MHRTKHLTHCDSVCMWLSHKTRSLQVVLPIICGNKPRQPVVIPIPSILYISSIFPASLQGSYTSPSTSIFNWASHCSML